jgi:hypothetical protein
LLGWYSSLADSGHGVCFVVLFVLSDIPRELQAELYSIKENYFHVTFEALKNRWERCIQSQGEYFEGDGSQN